MLYDYIISNYQKDEPIFLEELPGKSKESIRQEMKKLTDEGKIERLYNGVYYLSYKTILGTKGKVSIDKYIQKKFLEVNGETSGYITGMQLSNQIIVSLWIRYLLYVITREKPRKFKEKQSSNNGL